MKFRPSTFALFLFIGIASLSVEILTAQAPARGAAPAPAPAAAGRGRATGAPTARAQQVHGTLLQVMRGILFPNSNVIFAAQSQDPAAIKKDADPTASTNPLASMYGGWEAIENSGIAIAESANLLTIAGRVCSNGKPAPIQNADWQQFVKGLRDAGMATYQAAKSKDMDKVVEAADTMTTACANCHDVYREKTPSQGGLAARCTK